MSGWRLVIHREENRVFVFARREKLTGQQAARVTDRCIAVLTHFQDYLFQPAHDADVFAWVVEFACRRAADRFLRILRRSYRDQSA